MPKVYFCWTAEQSASVAGKCVASALSHYQHRIDQSFHALWCSGLRDLDATASAV